MLKSSLFKPSERPFTRTRSGLNVSLLNPQATTITLADIAHSLARIPRFLGHTQTEIPYSVAQHCVMGAEAVLLETSDLETALHFLLHDFHEAFIGDIIRPTIEALDAIIHVEKRIPYLLSEALETLKERMNGAIYEALKMPAMPNEKQKVAVRYFDNRMLADERRAMLTGGDSWGEAVEGQTPIRHKRPSRACWNAKIAERELIGFFERYHPVLMKAHQNFRLTGIKP